MSLPFVLIAKSGWIYQKHAAVKLCNICIFLCEAPKQYMLEVGFFFHLQEMWPKYRQMKMFPCSSFLSTRLVLCYTCPWPAYILFLQSLLIVSLSWGLRHWPAGAQLAAVTQPHQQGVVEGDRHLETLEEGGKSQRRNCTVIRHKHSLLFRRG